MSFEVAGLVLRARTGLGMGAKMVLLGLAEHAHPDGTEARPAIKTLARYAECDERTVRRHLRKLESAGIIATETPQDARSKKGRPVEYRIVLAALGELTPDRTPDPTQVGAESPQVAAVESAPNGATPDTTPALTESPGDRTQRPAPPDDLPPEPVLEPVQNPSTAPSARRDLHWETFTDLFGEPVGESERSRRGRAVKLVREVAPEEIRRLVAWARDGRRESWQRNLAGTDMALAANIGRLRHLSHDPITDIEATDWDAYHADVDARVAELVAERGAS